MIIKFLLIAGLLSCIAYMKVQRHSSRLLSRIVVLVALVGIIFVIQPGLTNKLASFVGVGRGADLIIYCWLLISLILIVNLQLKIISVNQTVTELARQIALQSPAKQTQDMQGNH
jgi:small membrane protein